MVAARQFAVIPRPGADHSVREKPQTFF